MRIVSSYNESEIERYHRERTEAEARFKYDETRSEILVLAEEFRGIEDSIPDGTYDMHDASYIMDFLSSRCQKLSSLYTEAHRWRLVLKDLGVEP